MSEAKHTPSVGDIRSALDAVAETAICCHGGASVQEDANYRDETRNRIVRCLLPAIGCAAWSVAPKNLIAAAPDLLAACKRATQQIGDLLAAIRDQGIEAHFRDDRIDIISESCTAMSDARAAVAKAEGA